MTALVVILMLALIVGASLLWYFKRWPREFALLVMLIATVTLGLYTKNHIDAERTKDLQYKACLRGNTQREAVQQFARDNPGLNGIDALASAFMPVSCEAIYDKPKPGP